MRTWQWLKRRRREEEEMERRKRKKVHREKRPTRRMSHPRFLRSERMSVLVMGQKVRDIFKV
jgi:hypothetical protein